MPWDLTVMNWKKYIPAQGKAVIAKIKEASQNQDAIVIATDSDPSGEGDMIGWDIIDALNWKKDVYRIRFNDETEYELIKALKSKEKIQNKLLDGVYLKARARGQFDYASMQLTRIATSLLRNGGHDIKAAKQGRLKSVILLQVLKRLDEIENFQEKKYYEIRYKDNKGNIYKQKKFKRFDAKEDVQNLLKNLNKTDVTKINQLNKNTPPPALIDLMGIASKLSKKYSFEEIKKVYQKMYQDGVVSYPRTEDKKISEGHYNQMLNKVDDIAELVNVDKNLLTNRIPRKTHVVFNDEKPISHGANRPGINVPKNLKDLDVYGDCAQDIYLLLAKYFLAMFCNDYKYQEINANLLFDQSFETSLKKPVEKNWKILFDQKIDDKSLGETAIPFVYEGINKKPQTPNIEMLKKYLEAHHVGTGATRLETIIQLTRGNDSLLKEKKGNLILSNEGKLSAFMAKKTWIGSATITNSLTEIMNEIKEKKRNPEDIFRFAKKLIDHDKKVMIENLEKVRKNNTLMQNKSHKNQEQEYINAVYKNKSVVFNRVFSKHRFTDEEVTNLLNDQKITFDAINKKNKSYTCTGKLGYQTGKSGKYLRFIADFMKK